MVLQHAFIIVSDRQFRLAVYLENVGSSSVAHVVAQSRNNKCEFLKPIQYVFLTFNGCEFVATLHHLSLMLYLLLRGRSCGKCFSFRCISIPKRAKS